VWRRDELAALRDRAEHAGVPVLSDEIHSDLVFPGETFVPWLSTGGATERDMALIAPSKTFNIPGLPTATAVVPHASWRQQYKAALNAHMLRLPNLLAITAAEAAYRHGAAWLDQVRSTIFDHYHVVRSTLAEEPGVVVHRMEGTFIAWIDLRERWSTLPPRDGSRSERFGAFARTQGVWLSDGRHFGPEGEGCMRMNVATSRETLEEGLRRFRGALTAFDAQESAG
jgi:cystathionine beta-lyase